MSNLFFEPNVYWMTPDGDHTNDNKMGAFATDGGGSQVGSTTNAWQQQITFPTYSCRFCEAWVSVTHNIGKAYVNNPSACSTSWWSKLKNYNFRNEEQLTSSYAQAYFGTNWHWVVDGEACPHFYGGYDCSTSCYGGCYNSCYGETVGDGCYECVSCASNCLTTCNTESVTCTQCYPCHNCYNSCTSCASCTASCASSGT